MSKYYEIWGVPYTTVTLNSESGLISGDAFTLSFKSWIIYGAGSADANEVQSGVEDSYVSAAEEIEIASSYEVVGGLEEDDTTVDYDMVWGNTNSTGSYPVYVGYGTSTSYQQYFSVVWGQGDVSRPYFKDPQYEVASELGSEVGELGSQIGSAGQTFSAAAYVTTWDVVFNVHYDGEVGEIKNKWQKYGEAVNGPDNFSAGLSSLIAAKASEIYNYSPAVEKPNFMFQKTKRPPMDLSKLSVFGEQEQEGITVTATSTTTTSTTGGSTSY